LPYLFDTDAVSELLKPKPAAPYVRWLRAVPREDQYISAVSVGELYHGAFRSASASRHLANIEEMVLPTVTVLPFDTGVARTYGEIRAELEAQGTPLAEADLQIAATARFHALELVTGNIRHFERVPGLVANRVLWDAKRR
jgi:predicted nucleic acid-binding protein